MLHSVETKLLYLSVDFMCMFIYHTSLLVHCFDAVGWSTANASIL